MSAANVAPAKRETLNIRVKPAERSLIDRAARTRGKNRTDFILDAARQAADRGVSAKAVGGIVAPQQERLPMMRSVIKVVVMVVVFGVSGAHAQGTTGVQ